MFLACLTCANLKATKKKSQLFPYSSTFFQLYFLYWQVLDCFQFGKRSKRDMTFDIVLQFFSPLFLTYIFLLKSETYIVNIKKEYKEIKRCYVEI